MNKLIILNAITSAIYMILVAIVMDIFRSINNTIVDGMMISLFIYSIIEVISIILSCLLHNKYIDN